MLLRMLCTGLCRFIMAASIHILQRDMATLQSETALLAKENQALKEHSERLNLEKAALVTQIESAKKKCFRTATFSSDDMVHVSTKGTLDPEGESSDMHLGLPCKNADEVRQYEQSLDKSWKDFKARNYR